MGQESALARSDEADLPLISVNPWLLKAMTSQDFQRVYPLITDWIDQTLRTHASFARPVASVGFARLSRCFSSAILASSKYIPVINCPVPPLASWGLHQFSDFQKMVPDGITYLDSYFVRDEKEGAEDLHFHELIHVIQWKLLGPGRFIAYYADGLEKFGYEQSPLEQMAYSGQRDFVGGRDFDVEAFVGRALLQAYPGALI
jgi:hypothetical protein